MTEEQHSGDLYWPSDAAILEEQNHYLDMLYDFNQTRPTEFERRQSLLKQLFGDIGDDCYIEPPFRANWGGHHVHFGNHIYANFNFTAVDDTHIYVGNHTMIGPNVTIATAAHPILPELREREYQYNLPVHIGKNCWLGAGVIILPGVTLGDNVVVGAGSVVTKDLPDNVVAVETPCKVLRQVNESNRQQYAHHRPINWQKINAEMKKRES